MDLRYTQTQPISVYCTLYCEICRSAHVFVHILQIYAQKLTSSQINKQAFKKRKVWMPTGLGQELLFAFWVCWALKTFLSLLFSSEHVLSAPCSLGTWQSWCMYVHMCVYIWCICVNCMQSVCIHAVCMWYLCICVFMYVHAVTLCTNVWCVQIKFSIDTAKVFFIIFSDLYIFTSHLRQHTFFEL